MFNLVSFDLAAVCQIISGVILMKSLYTIRSYFKQNSTLGSTNSKEMLTHAICYGLYLVISAVYSTIYNIYMIDTKNEIFVIFLWFSTIYYVCASISLIMLCYIFWGLMTKPQRERI